MKKFNAYIGLVVHNESIAVAIAESSRNAEIRFYGNIYNKKSQIKKLVDKLNNNFGSIAFAYEAGPCVYAVYRTLVALNQVCEVVAPSHIQKKPDDRINSDHRDAMGLARLFRAGDMHPLGRYAYQANVL